MARKDKLALQSLLEQIIRHLLLIQYWEEEKERNSRHWHSEVISFRYQINRRMTKNLFNYLDNNLSLIYTKARRYVMDKSGVDTFPLECTYSLDKLLDEDWFPLS